MGLVSSRWRLCFAALLLVWATLTLNGCGATTSSPNAGSTTSGAASTNAVTPANSTVVPQSGAGPAETVANNGTAMAVGGQAYDGPVANAPVGFYSDPLFTNPITSDAVVTTDDGTFAESLPASALSGLSVIYVQSTGGVDVVSGAPGITLQGYLSATSASGDGQVVLSLVSTLAMMELALDPGANVDQTLTQVKAMFGLSSSANVNGSPVVAGDNVDSTSRMILWAAEFAHPELEPGASQTAAYLSDLANGIASGVPDLTALNRSFADLSLPPSSISTSLGVFNPPLFPMTGLLLGVQPVDLTTATFGAGANLFNSLSVSVASSVPTSGATMPDLTLVLGNSLNPTINTTFVGTVELDFSLPGDLRSLSLRFTGLQFTSSSIGANTAINVPPAATLSAGGIDGNGIPVSSVSSSMTSSGPAVVTVAPLVSGAQATFHMAPVLQQMGAILFAIPPNHPLTLLNALGTVNVSLMFSGFPVSSGTARIGSANLTGLLRQN